MGEAMDAQNPANVHYRRLLDSAEKVLRGPSSIRIDIDFWGEWNLLLRKEAMPKVEGIIESRIVYANPADDDQDGAILRHASWNARTARKTVWEDFGAGRTPSIVHPALNVHYVWITLDWLYQVVRSLGDFSVPLGVPETSSRFRTMYELGIQRIDRTYIKVAWGKNMPEAYHDLSCAWEGFWQQMTDLLRDGKRVEPEERWWPSSTPVYQRKLVDSS
jgi:hypothetical protein